MAEAAGGRRPVRRPTQDELLLWRHAMRGVVPAHPQPPAAEPLPQSAEAPARVAGLPRSAHPSRAPSLPARPTQRLDPSGPIDLDRRSWQRLRRGRYPVDARLDLHGMTQAQAHDALSAFLSAAQARGNRCVLVITGRGSMGGGALRAMTPRWLDESPNRQRLLTYAPARPRHGGDGAIYVLLRRRA
jgi:DNA-nicking Smr family endonuclease